MNHKMDDKALEQVAGGATVVEIAADEKSTPRCFSCKSTNVKVERAGNYETLTCNACGAVDVRVK